MKKTRIFQMVDPTMAKWDIYEALIPALDASYGLHADAKLKVHINRRKINRLGNLMTVEYYAENESDFYQMDYDAIQIITKGGLVFKMLSTVNETVIKEHQVCDTYQLTKDSQSKLNWDRWMRVLKLFDDMCGEYGVKTERIFYPKRFALHYDCRFTSWKDFSNYCWEMGRVVEQYQLSIESIDDITAPYQLDLFEDILDLTDSKRVRDYA